MSIKCQINLLFKIFVIDSTVLPLWVLITSRQICAILNHGKVIKADPSWVVPRKLAANLELLTVVYVNS